MTSRNKLGTVVKVLKKKLEDLAANYPEKKVGLVAFGHNVKICLGAA